MNYHPQLETLAGMCSRLLAQTVGDCNLIGPAYELPDRLRGVGNLITFKQRTALRCTELYKAVSTSKCSVLGQPSFLEFTEEVHRLKKIFPFQIVVVDFEPYFLKGGRKQALPDLKGWLEWKKTASPTENNEAAYHRKEFLRPDVTERVFQVNQAADNGATVFLVSTWAGSGRYRKEPQNPHRIFVVRVSHLAQLVVVCWRYM